MKGRLIGVSVGPGDPELLTLKALRYIKENNVIAIPSKNITESVAYKIVKGAYPELDEKNLLAVDMPMIKDKELLKESHDRAAALIEGYLDQRENVVFLTLGDATVYSTYIYVHKRVIRDGYEAEIVSGVTSFCASAARLGTSLAENRQPVHIIPATYKAESMGELLSLDGTKVLMKSGKRMAEVKKAIKESGSSAMMIENCGMPDERVYLSTDEIPDDAGYYSLIIIKE